MGYKIYSYIPVCTYRWQAWINYSLLIKQLYYYPLLLSDKINDMKNPFFIIIGLFLLVYIAVGQLSSRGPSDSPVVLTKADPPKILMFGSQTCQYCKTARTFFEQHKLPYIEKDIDIDTDARRVFDLMNGRGTPLLIINGQTIHGYDENLIRNAL